MPKLLPAFVVACALALVGGAALAKPGHKLHQESDFYGVSTVCISPSCMRLESSRLGLKLSICQPDYQMTAINETNKQFAQLTYDRWSGFMDGNRVDKVKPRILRRGKTKIAGFDADEYWIFWPLRDSVDKTRCKEMWVNGEPYNTKYWATKQIQAPQSCYAMFSGSLGAPGALGLPLRMYQVNSLGRVYKTFDTTSIEKCDVPDVMPVPKGYSQAPDEMALIVSGSTSTELGALLADDAGEFFPSTKAAAGRPRRRGWVPGMDLTAESGSLNVGRARSGGSWVPTVK